MTYARLFLVSGLVAFSQPALAASSRELMAQGRWAEAADQAEAEKDYLTAATALDRQMECPSRTQPKGQQWDMELSRRGLALARLAAGQFQSGPKAVEAQLLLGTHVGHMAGLHQEGTNIPAALNAARESKSAFEKATQLDARDLPAAATYAMYLGRGYNRGGLLLGFSKVSAQMAALNAAKLFNVTPDTTREDQLNKALGALRLATAFESLRDSRLAPYFEAVIKLGTQAGGAEGRCLANVARLHLNRPITDF